jgi:hypothetical protein
VTPALAMSRPSHILAAALALVSLGLASLVWRQRGEIARLHATLERTANVGGVRRGAGQPAASTLTRALAVPLSRPARAVNSPARDDEFVPASAAAAPKAPRRATGLARLMADPEFIRAFTMHQEGALDARFADLFRRLNLSGEELAQFKRLLVEKESVALDVVAISQETPGGPLPAAEVSASIRAAQSSVESAILASLGRDRYAVYHDFERTIAERAMVARLEQRLSYTATPLQPAQAEAVVRILARDEPAETVSSRPAIAVLTGAGAPEGTPIVRAAPVAAQINEEVISRTQGVLSGPQIEALRQIQVEMGAAAQAARMLNALVPEVPDTDDILPALRILTQ